MSQSRPLYVRCREQLENLVKRRFFLTAAFEVYGGVAGLYDFGPPGCALKAEVEALWRRHFVLEEDMLEVSCTCMTPEIVLKTSGHVDRFTDLMVKDVVTSDCYRADKLLEEFIEVRQATQKLSPEESSRLQKLKTQAGSLPAADMHQAFKDLNVRSPDKNECSEPYPFHLMFKTSIGPKGDLTGYLRPETSQGIFVNFRRLLESNGGKIPFAAAQLGLGFRNEIAPRAGLLRVREFQMAEIEHFVDPKDKTHVKFSAIKGMKLPLFSREKQIEDGKVIDDLPLEFAVKEGVINNETLAYFLARTYLFLLNCGIQPCGLRFRQHLENEMAHYACDCWDAEIETSYGWIECVGHADRSAFDLTHHSKASRVDLIAHRRYDTPQDVKFVKLNADRKLLGLSFKHEQKAIIEALEELPDEKKMDINSTLQLEGEYELELCTGQKYKLTKDMINFEEGTKRVVEEPFTPGVVEPSFGIGRIIYCILEHNFRSREIEAQEERCYLAMPPRIAPTKCSILPVSASADLLKVVKTVKAELTALGVSSMSDTSGASIGRRYARTDEIGIPFGVTVDFDTLNDKKVTLRDRDTMKQVRLPIAEVAQVVLNMVQDRASWKDINSKYPEFIAQEKS